MNKLITIQGEAVGYFRYGDVQREFNGLIFVVLSTVGGLIVHQINELKAVRPVCYIEAGADIALARNLADCPMELSAIADDGREILVTFSKIEWLNGSKYNPKKALQHTFKEA